MREEIDEQDGELMAQLAHHVCLLIPTAFSVPSSAPNLTLHWLPVNKLATTDDVRVESFVDMIDATMGELYTKHRGRHWKMEKLVEAREPGLVYIWLQDQSAIVGYLSVKVVLNEGQNVLYLYEIHIDPAAHGRGWGSHLISCYHRLALRIAKPTPLDSTCLTVFADNDRALKWYRDLGYKLAENSPTDRKLRGSIKRPSYYILARPTTH